MSGPGVGNCQPERDLFGSVWDDPNENLGKPDDPSTKAMFEFVEEVTRK
jgi:hypothetical protein